MKQEGSYQEIMDFLKTHMATKGDIVGLQNQIIELRQEMLVGFDEVSSRFDEVRVEFIDVRAKMADMQTSVTVLDGKVDQIQVDLMRLNKRDEEDTKALANDMYVLKKRVIRLEGKVN